MFVQRKRKKGIRFNFCLKTPELMIFERKEKLPLARNERNETRASCRREKSARKRKNCHPKHERRKNERKEKKEKKCVTNAPTKQAHHTPQLKNA